MTRQGWINLAVVLALLATAASTFGAVFGDHTGYLAALGGLLIGGGLAALAAQLRWSAWASVLAIVVGYLALGPAFATQSTNVAVVVPTLASLQLLVLQPVNGWMDFLTAQPPLAGFIGPTVLPLFATTVASAIAVTLALRTRRPASALIPVATLGIVGIAWGSQYAPLAVAVGALGVAVAMLWVSGLSRAKRRAATEEFAAHATGAWRPVASVLVMTAAAVGVAFIAPAGPRVVLRDHVEPPLQVQEYHSPLTSFRHYVNNQADDVLFSVGNYPEGYRVRLAALDSYDGTVFRVGEQLPGDGFRRVGTVTTDAPLPAGAQPLELDMTIGAYRGFWLPGGGDLRHVEFSGTRASDLQQSLYVSRGLGSALTRARLLPEDAYSVELVPHDSPSDTELATQSFAEVPMAKDEAVPDVVGALAAELTADVDSPIQQVRAIEQFLHTKGYFSSGLNEDSLSGHRSARIRGLLLNPDQMIGDDEQYAVAMALMCRQLGIPARVVMGFYPEAGQSGPLEITGTQTHAWVEVAFSQAGWVSFDPTPPRDQQPKTQVPKPKVKPKPQVLQPPPPPVEPAEQPPDYLPDDKPETDEVDEPMNLLWLWVTLASLGGLALILAPFAVVLAIKGARRSRRRSTGTPREQAISAWDEVLDRATDLRLVPGTGTRREQAAVLDRRLFGEDAPVPGFGQHGQPNSASALGDLIDAAAYAPAPMGEALTERAWQDASELGSQLGQRYPARQRALAAVSLRSLRRGRP